MSRGILSAAAQPPQLSNALAVVEQEIPKCNEQDQPKFRYRVNKIKLDIEKYATVHAKANEKVSQIEGPRPQQFAHAREYQQLETAVEGQQKHIEGRALLDQHIKNACKGRYDLLQQNGFPQAKNSLDFYQLRARDEQLIKGDPIKVLPPESSKVKQVFFNCIKVSAGLICGLSLNKIINPDNYEIVTVALLFVGAGLGVFMLHLSKSLSFRAKLDPKPARYLITLGVVVLLFMVAEGYLNYEGVISVTREMAMESAGDGLLLDEAGDVEQAPAHYSLLVFTLVLVAFAALSAVLEGKDKATRMIQQLELDRAVAHLRANKALMEHGATIDKPQFLESLRGQIERKPVQKPLVRWHNNAVKHLSKHEQLIDNRVSQIGHELEQKSEKIQAEIHSLAEDIYMSQTGQKKRLIIPFGRTA